MGQLLRQAGAGVWRRRPDGFTVLLAGVGALAAGLALARQVNAGMALPWDTVAYISVARSLLEGAGLTRFDGHPLTNFPPFYPILLAAASFGVFDPYATAAPLNAVLFGLTAFAGGHYLRRRLRYPALALGGALALALSLPMARIASAGLSEPLFILLAMLALIQTDRLLREGQGSALLGAALFTALAWLTRYTGVALVGVIALLLAIQPQIGLKRKALRIGVYLALAAAPAALWMARNYVQYGIITGYRGHPARPLPEVLDQVLVVLTEWAFPAPPWGFFEYNSPWLIGVLLLAATAGAAYDGFRVWRKKPAWVVSRSFVLFTGFAVAYCGLVIGAVAAGNVSSSVQPRYLTPIYFALVLAGALAVDALLVNAGAGRLTGWAGRRRRLRLRLPGLIRGRRTAAASGMALLAAVALSAGLGWSAALNAQAIVARNGEQPGTVGLYETPQWADSPLVDYVRQAAPAGVILSNDAAATYAHIAAPARHRYAECTMNTLLQQVHNESLRHDVYVLWFRELGYPRCLDQGIDYNFSGVRAIPELAPVAELADGTVLKAEMQKPPALAQYAQEHLGGTRVFSNIAGLLAEYQPDAEYRDIGTDFSAAQWHWLEDDAVGYVVWYNNPHAEPVTAAGLAEVLELETTAVVGDSIVAKIDYGYRQGSELYRYIERHLGRGPVVSNAVATFAPHFPRTHFDRLPDSDRDRVWWLLGNPELDGARIVYWYDAADASRAAVDALAQLPGVARVAELADGVVLAVEHEFLDNSAVLRYVRENLAGASVLSNAHYAMDEYPGNGDYEGLDTGLSSFRWQALGAPDGFYIAWIDALAAPLYQYDGAKLRQAPLLRVAAELSDGVILQLDDRLGDGVRYEVYYDRGRNALVYVREECPPANPEHRFYLLAWQADGSPALEQPGYLKFNLDEYGSRSEGRCVATVPLAAGAAASSIRTGQYRRQHWPIWRLETALEKLPEPPAAVVEAPGTAR